MARFDESSIPDQTGRTAIVTGGNSGIGLEAAVSLARRGASVVIACRDPKRAEAALESIRDRASSTKVRALPLDLARLSSVREFADAWLASGEAIDLLINNAGVMALPHGKTEDGYETQFATNHLGHFALTLRLVPALERGRAARVVTVSSMTHGSGKIPFEDLHGDARYSPSGAYANSKLANLLFAYELDRRLRAAGKATRSIACHPGMSATQITMGSMRARGSEALGKFLVWGNSVVAQPASMGALPTLYAATEPSLHGGEYVGPDGLFGARGYPKVAQSSAASRDVADAARLWGISEQLTGVRLV